MDSEGFHSGCWCCCLLLRFWAVGSAGRATSIRCGATKRCQVWQKPKCIEGPVPDKKLRNVAPLLELLRTISVHLVLRCSQMFSGFFGGWVRGPRLTRLSRYDFWNSSPMHAAHPSWQWQSRHWLQPRHPDPCPSSLYLDRSGDPVTPACPSCPSSLVLVMCKWLVLHVPQPGRCSTLSTVMIIITLKFATPFWTICWLG